jgi:hypothetical protein
MNKSVFYGVLFVDIWNLWILDVNRDYVSTDCRVFVSKESISAE